MSYSEDVVISKLSVLNETQESIVGISQWIMFHKRNAQQSAHVWARYLGNVPVNKKLALVYLANEIVQQSRAKKKDEFVTAFGKVLPGALDAAYKVSPQDTQARIKRVVDVWKQRSIFSPATINQIEGLISGSARRTEPDTGTSPLNMGLFGAMASAGTGGGAPEALQPVISVYKSIEKSSQSNNASTTLKLYKDLFESDVLPAPPLFARKLGDLATTLKNAKSTLTQTISFRDELDEKIKVLIEANDAAKRHEKELLENISEKESSVLETKQEVEQMLVSDIPDQEQEDEPEAPEPEPLSDIEDEYKPEPVNSSAVPAYSPLSSDEEDEQSVPAAKKLKIDSAIPVAGLDPAVAALLSNLGK